MDKKEVVSILKSVGWVINRPEEIEVIHTEPNFVILAQLGNGEWTVTENGSVTFFEDEDE